MTQPTLELFAPAQRHSATSVAAASKIELSAGTLRAVVLAYLKVVDGATDEEIQQALSMNPSTERPRRVELVQRGLVRDSGKTRPTVAGRAATVWRAI